jgi:hypothetical protein
MAAVHIKRARGAFLHLATAQPSLEEGKEPKFNGNFIIEKDSESAKAVRAAMEAVAIEKWGANGVKILDNLEASKRCLRDGDKALDKNGDPYKGFAGHDYVVASNLARPTLYSNRKDPATGKAQQLAPNDPLFYSGAYFNVQIDVYAVDKPEKKIKGVFCELRGVQFSADGERLGGSSVASADEFDVDEEEDDIGF